MSDDRLTVARVRECKSEGRYSTLIEVDQAQLILAQSDLLRRMAEMLENHEWCKDVDGCDDCRTIRALLAELDKLEGATNDEGGE